MANRLLWLPHELAAAGLRVETVRGFETRGVATMRPEGVIAHHDAFRSTISASAAVALMVNGRSDLPGPLCQIWIDDDADDTARKGDPLVYVIASGRANHAGAGSWHGIAGNSKVIGIEARNNGRGESWSPAMRNVYYRTAAVCAAGIGVGSKMICGHKEWTSRKIDPAGLDMNEFRRNATGFMRPSPSPIPPDQEETLMQYEIIRAPNGRHAKIMNSAAYVYPQTDEGNAWLWHDAVKLDSVGVKTRGVSWGEWNLETRSRVNVANVNAL